MSPLRDDLVELWLTRAPEEGFTALLPRLLPQLAEDEIEQAHRFVFERHRILYTVAHSFLRSILSERLGRAPREIVLVREAGGRPELSDRALRFNLSHTEGVVLVGVTKTADLGVDVERIRDRTSRELAQTVFTPGERADWDGSERAFFERWTLKEAYIKARGLGLSLDLQQFGFDIGDPPRLVCEPAFDDPSAWRFRSFCASPEVAAAAALRSVHGGAVEWRLTMHESAY